MERVLLSHSLNETGHSLGDSISKGQDILLKVYKQLFLNQDLLMHICRCGEAQLSLKCLLGNFLSNHQQTNADCLTAEHVV